MKEYSFNRVLGPESRQEEVYKLTTQPLVDALYMGKSGACMGLFAWRRGAFVDWSVGQRRHTP